MSASLRRMLRREITRNAKNPRRFCGLRGLSKRSHPIPCVRDGAHAEPERSPLHQRAKSGVLWMNAFSFEMFTLPKPVVASQPAFAL